MAVDWLRIRNDYINGGGSYRKLAEKYGVSFSTLEKKARQEKWTAARDAQCDRVETATRQKTVEKTADALSEEAAARVRIRGKLLGLAERWIDGLQEGGIYDTGDFRKIVQSCVDLGIVQESGEGDAPGGVKDDELSKSLRELAEEFGRDDQQ